MQTYCVEGDPLSDEDTTDHIVVGLKAGLERRFDENDDTPADALANVSTLEIKRKKESAAGPLALSTSTSISSSSSFSQSKFGKEWDTSSPLNGARGAGGGENDDVAGKKKNSNVEDMSSDMVSGRCNYTGTLDQLMYTHDSQLEVPLRCFVQRVRINI